MSVIFGLVGGRLVASFGLLAIGYNLTVGSKLSGISAYSFLDFLFLLLLFPILSLICSLWLVFFPVSSERRGTLGFISLIGSITPTFYLILTILRLFFPHRDTPTGL
jgi:hypothetical protein